MDKFVPEKKMSKKARKLLAAKSRNTWAFSPVTRTVGSKKIYDRKKIGSMQKFVGETALCCPGLPPGLH